MSTDDTFASTLTGIDELRSRHGSDDWPEWRRTVVDAVRAGAQLERLVRQLEGRLPGFAKAEAYSTLSLRLQKLELLQSSHGRSVKWGGDLLKMIIAGILGAVATKVFK